MADLKGDFRLSCDRTAADKLAEYDKRAKNMPRMNFKGLATSKGESQAIFEVDQDVKGPDGKVTTKKGQQVILDKAELTERYEKTLAEVDRVSAVAKQVGRSSGSSAYFTAMKGQHEQIAKALTEIDPEYMISLTRQPRKPATGFDLGCQ